MRNAGGLELGRMIEHGLLAVRRNDAKSDRVVPGYLVAMVLVHCAGVEGGDLVVVQIGGDIGLGGELILHAQHEALADSELVEPVGVAVEVGTDGGHRQRVGTEPLQAISDVAGAAAEVAAHLRHQEGYVEHMGLVRQDVILEPVRKDHDGVVSQ